MRQNVSRMAKDGLGNMLCFTIRIWGHSLNHASIWAGYSVTGGTMEHRLSLEHIQHVATVIDPIFLHTPQFPAESLSDRLQAQIIVKIETLNPIRSFKGRGAAYFVV